MVRSRACGALAPCTTRRPVSSSSSVARSSSPSPRRRRAAPTFDLAGVIRVLRKLYGAPAPRRPTEPFALVLWENVAYLANDAQRARAFALLKRTVGLAPPKVRAAAQAKLLAVTSHGILPVVFAAKLRRAAELAREHFDDDVAAAARQPLAAALRAMRTFPGIGEPGAETILLFARAHPVLGLDSNGLRVLVRLGAAREGKNYAATYAAVRRALAPALPTDFDRLITAHRLLRRHGQEICRRARPTCEICPLSDRCDYYRTVSADPTPEATRGR